MIRYVVVEPNKAHVVVSMGKGRKVFHPAKEGSKSSYWYIPLIMRRIVVSLENVKHEINDIVLRDKNVAPFKCDITCWFKITNADLAAEKLDVDNEGNIMTSIRETLNAQVQGVARNAAMKQEILDLMRDRKTFGEGVFETVNGDLDEWGVQLVKLEIIDFTDVDGSTVIKDFERRSQATINSATRIAVAEQNQLAQVKEAIAEKQSQQAQIDANQTIEMRDIEREQTVATRREEARLKVAETTDKANAKEVLALKTKTIGEAQIVADASVIKADGESLAMAKKAEGQRETSRILAEGSAQAVKLEAEATSEAITKKGIAEAEVTRQKGTAEADAVEKKADAQKKFTDASKEIEMTKIAADVEKAKYASMAQAMSSANIQVVSPDMNFMGFGAKEGAGLGMLVDALQKSSGIKVADVVDAVAGKSKKE